MTLNFVQKCENVSGKSEKQIYSSQGNSFVLITDIEKGKRHIQQLLKIIGYNVDYWYRKRKKTYTATSKNYRIQWRWL